MCWTSIFARVDIGSAPVYIGAMCCIKNELRSCILDVYHSYVADAFGRTYILGIIESSDSSVLILNYKCILKIDPMILLSTPVSFQSIQIKKTWKKR
jgi:hypothetical protein